MKKMKILFCGNYRKQAGPSQANRQYLQNFPPEVDYLKSSNKVLELLEALFKTVSSDVLVFSSGRYINVPVIYWATKLLKKRCVFIAHGCTKAVATIEGSPLNADSIKIENICVDKADLVLCVSGPFTKLMQNEFPEAAHKIKELTNPVDWDELDKIGSPQTLTKDINLIISAGGGRYIKKNLQVAQAIELLNKKNNSNLRYEIYGAKNDSELCRQIESIPCVTFPGNVSRREFLDRLKVSALYVQNSIFEPFGLAPIEALLCGNDLLISKYIAAKEIIKNLQPGDIIENPDDIDELASKIEAVLENGNNQRLLSSIDRETTSGQFVVNRLMEYCRNLLEQENS